MSRAPEMSRHAGTPGMSPTIGPAPAIHASQVGWMCSGRKRVVVPAEAAGGSRQFLIQDLGRLEGQALGSGEDFACALRGELAPHEGPMGSWLVGDFSAVRGPGVYRAVLPGADASHPAAWSFPFTVSDGAWSGLPWLFLDYVHSQRCGRFEDERRGPCHLDDGMRSDTRAPVDVSGGWHDAGDLRKWLATTVLPVLGFLALRRRGLSRNHWRERPYVDDFAAETAWGIDWVLKMQDPGTGMFYEDVGGGGESRRQPGMSWWHENHAGVYADNEGNRFTDNRPASGDERSVRVQYNPIAQYTAICVLLDAGEHLNPEAPALSRQCRDAAQRCWDFMKGRRRDAFHGWTSVIAWRLLAALRLHTLGVASESEVSALVSVMLDLQSPGGYWYRDQGRDEPYRGILGSAQPLIALAGFLDNDDERPLAGQVRGALQRCYREYVLPMLQTNPFGVMPYGLFSRRGSPSDSWHEWKDGLVYRFFMPTDTPQKVVHGLASHWTSWAHALAVLADILGDDGCRDAAWDQLGWLAGSNPLNACMIAGVGCRNASPYSRFYGAIAGGFSVGPVGDAADQVSADLDGRMIWSTGEYWMAPLASACQALATLLPPRVLARGKLG